MSKTRKDGRYDERYKGGRALNNAPLSNSVMVFILYVIFIPTSIVLFYIIPMPYNFIVAGFVLCAPFYAHYTQTDRYKSRKLLKFVKSLPPVEDQLKKYDL